MDRPEHTFHRRLVATEFSAKRISRLRSHIQKIVDEQVRAMEDSARPVDLVKALAEPVTSRVISQLLGLPESARCAFQDLSRIVLSRDSHPDQLSAASAQLKAMISELLVEKESGSPDDFLGRLIRKYRKLDCYDHQQMIQLVGSLVTAGHETTANMISLGVVLLLNHPEQLAELSADPGLLKGAVDELLRYLSVADVVTARVAVRDVELDGCVIRAGDGLIALGAAANHDHRAFHKPEVLDLHRSCSHHVAFGYGAHNCLGQHLARLELEVVFATLFERIPTLRLATCVEELLMKERDVFYGVKEVPVTW